MGVFFVCWFLIVLCGSGSTTTVQQKGGPEEGPPFPRACVAPYNKYPFCNTSLSTDERIEDLMSRLPSSVVGAILTARESVAVPSIGLPAYDWGMNAIHGVQSKCGQGGRCPTSFPDPCGLGAAWNASMVKTLGAVIGWEARSLWLQRVTEASNTIPIGLDAWSPNININRDPRWGRNQEVPGEDPFWSGVYGEMYSKGIQEGPDKRYLLGVITLKHWMAYSVENYDGVDRHNFNAIISKFDFHDTYTPAWEQSIEQGGAMGVMCSYNAVNGTPTCGSEWLTKTLRVDFGFKGYMTSDSGAINDIWAHHKYVENATAAAGVAANAECDINSGGVYKSHLEEAVQKGYTTQDAVRLLLKRSLNIRFRLGLFDPIENQPYWHVKPDIVASPEHEASAQLAAKETMTLLKNDKNTLPLKVGSNIALVGPHVNAQRDLVGNYIGHLCVGGGFSCIEKPSDAISQMNNGGQTTVNPGCKSVSSCPTDMIKEAVTAAKAADVVVIIGGIDESIEREGHDRHNITLPDQQVSLIQAVAAVGKPVVLVLINGGMVAIDQFVGSMSSVVEAWYPSFWGSMAITDTLFGKYNPSGKLPVTWYRGDYVNQIPFLDMSMTVPPGRGYRYFTGEPLYEFGYGLSYTTFDMKFSTGGKAIVLAKGANYNVKILVRNTGTHDGDEVVFAFFQPTVVHMPSSQPHPLKKQLFGVERKHIKQGHSVEYSFDFALATFAMFDVDGLKVVPEGAFDIVFSRGHGNHLTVPVKSPNTVILRGPLV